MIQPKRYKAITTEQQADPFTGLSRREVRGYYVKHVDAQVNPLSTKQQYDDFIAKHTRHYIFQNGWADWNLPTQLEQWEIDPTTLEEIPDEPL